MQVEADDFTYDAGVAAIEELLAQATPDAIVCANDLLAVAAIKVLQAGAASSVPGDVAVVGMDDTEIAELVVPSLTSVDLGSPAAPRPPPSLLLERLGDPQLPARQVTVEPSLTIRESSLGEPARRRR